MKRTRAQLVAILAFLLAILGMSPTAMADEHLRGVVTGRESDGSIDVKTDDSAKVIVVLQEITKVRELSGLRSIKVDASSLIPGLRIKADGDYDAVTHFVAMRVTFSRDDLKLALAIQGGLTPTDTNVAANRAAIDALSQETGQRFSQQQQALQQEGQRIAANDEKITATSGAVDATNNRIANLDDYSVLDTITVYFGNGQVKVAPMYQTQLIDFATKAKGTSAYKVSVEGFASAVGQPALNQRLSAQRADAVAAVLQQNGVSISSMLVPAAMGTSQQVAPNKTKKDQAQNRRVVVRLMQNRGITGQ
jgi:outer membrane protein OmpA-like peptidoglycan-associated protein